MSVVTVTANTVRRSQLDSARPNEPSLGTHEDSSPLAPRLSAGDDTDTRIAGIPRMRVRSGRLCATARGKRCARTETAMRSGLAKSATWSGIARARGRALDLRSRGTDRARTAFRVPRRVHRSRSGTSSPRQVPHSLPADFPPLHGLRVQLLPRCPPRSGAGRVHRWSPRQGPTPLRKVPVSTAPA